MIECLKPYYSVEEARELAFWVLEEVTGMSRAEIVMSGKAPLPPKGGAETDKLQQVIERLQRYEPVQYIFEKAYWRGMELLVTPAVLIPRPETAELVDIVISDKFLVNSDNPRVLDACTGSGCVAIALKKEHPEWVVEALDISEAALEIARENAKQNDVEVRFFQQDILAPLPHKEGVSYDVVVCNPPYIMDCEKAEMKANVLRYEPHEALFVPNDDPLRFYRAIAEQRLAPVLYFEIDHLQGQAVCELLESLGYSTELRQDMNGKDRMVKGVRNEM